MDQAISTEAAADWADWPVGVIRARVGGAVETANAAALDLLAPLAGGAPPRDLFALFGPAAAELRAAAAALRPGERLRRRLSTGESELAVTLLGDRAGRLTALLSDETAAIRAEREAQRQRARFAALADAAGPEAIYTLDRDGRVSGWSRSAERAEGLSAGEALGLPLETLLARMHVGADAPLLLSRAALQGSASISGLHHRAEGAPVEATLTLRAVRGAEGGLDGFVAILRERLAQTGREAELRRLAETDPLTGVLNRRAFLDAAAAALAACRAAAAPFAVIAFDLDVFKTLNDGLGHAAGDAALKAMTETARGDLRVGDLIGRLGGDEFAIALPRTDLDRATLIAERLRRAIERLRAPHGARHLRFTASFGVAVSEGGAEEAPALLNRADAALYRAKAAGRNRVAAA